MYRSNESKVLFAAMSTGMTAHFHGQLDVEDVAKLKIMAKEFLPHGGPALDLVTAAAAAFDLIHRKPEEVRAWGLKLRDDALRISRPAPVGADRADLHG